MTPFAVRAFAAIMTVIAIAAVTPADAAGPAATSAVTEKPPLITGPVDVTSAVATILNRWEPIAVRAGAHSPSWRELYGTQLRLMPEEWRKTFLRLQSRHDSESANASYKEFTQMFVSAQANIIDQSVLESDKVRSKLGFATTDLVFRATAPCRIVDTRNVGGPIVAGTTRNFYYYSTIGANSWAGQGGQPGSSVSACPGTVITSQGGYLGSAAPRAAALTITAVNTTAAGNFVVWGGQGPPPTSSVLNWTAGQVIADTVPVPWGGEISGALDFAVRYNGPSGQADVVVDVIGYFTVNWATALECVDTALVTTPISAGNLGEAVSPACPSTYTIVGGSCLIAGGGWLNNSRRTVNGWGCEAYGVTADFVSANARCCRVPGQ